MPLRMKNEPSNVPRDSVNTPSRCVTTVIMITIMLNKANEDALASFIDLAEASFWSAEHHFAPLQYHGKEKAGRK